MHLTTPAVNVLLATLIPTITIAQAVIQVIVLMVTPAQPLKSALVAQDQVLVTNAIQIRTAMYLLNIAHTDALLTTLVTNAFLVNPPRQHRPIPGNMSEKQAQQNHSAMKTTDKSGKSVKLGITA